MPKISKEIEYEALKETIDEANEIISEYKEENRKLNDKIIDLSADLGMYQNENECLTEDIEKYWQLEQELGCPLEVVFKALEEGIIYETDKESKCVLIPNLIYAELINDEIPYYYFVNYDLQNLENSSYAKLQDYQKTWWLKGEKDE